MNQDIREYPANPIAAVGAIVFKGESVLLIKRAREPSAGQWSIPGGKIELGETLAGAAVREVEEETGIEIRVDKVVNSYDNIIRDESGDIKYHYLIVYYSADYVSGEPRLSPESSDVMWKELSGVREMEMSGILKEIILAAFDRRRAGDQME
jgi:ADP-ribose pyrophosphatase YjhB (NUDIX family)